MNKRFKYIGYLLVCVAVLYIGEGLVRLIFRDAFPYACDLKLRWLETTALWNGYNPVEKMVSSDYPPWSYSIGLLLTPPFASWTVNRIYFGVLNILALLILGLWSYMVGKQKGAGIVATGASLALISNLYCLSNGQYGILMVAFLVLMYCCIKLKMDYTAGFFGALAMVKPHFAVFFLLIPLIHKRWRVILSAVMFVFIFSLCTQRLSGEGMIQMFIDAFNRSSEYVAQGQGLIVLLGWTSMTAASATMLLMVVGLASYIAMAWYWRASSLITLFALAAVFALLSVYHKAYDNVILVFLVVAVIRSYICKPTINGIILVVFLLISTVFPFRMKDHNNTVLQVVNSAIWLVAVVMLLKRDRLEKGNEDGKTLFVLDGNDEPCVRSLFSAMAKKGWRIVYFRPYSISFFVRVLHRSWLDTFIWREQESNQYHNIILLPGHARFPRVSLRILRWVIDSAMARFGRPVAVIYTQPAYAPLLEDRIAPSSIYFAYDAYRYYESWDTERVEMLERKYHEKADVVCVVSRQLEDDWRKVVKQELAYLPNAAADIFLSSGYSARNVPGIMSGMQDPVVGCVGHLNSSYDWELIGKMAETFTDVSFVFLGEIVDVTDRMNDVDRLPNVHYLGRVDRDTLLSCLGAFSICWNPLAVTDLNNRRCPLRLYDYLTTDLPVLSSAIREAKELDEYIAVFSDANECERIMKSMLAGDYAIDAESRRAFITQQSWSARADRFEEMLIKGKER